MSEFKGTPGPWSFSWHIGSYLDFFDAVCARKSAELKLDYHENHGRKP